MNNGIYNQTVRPQEIYLLDVEVTNALNYLHIFSRTNLQNGRKSFRKYALIVQLEQKIPKFYEVRSFNILLTRADHNSVFQSELIQSIYSLLLLLDHIYQNIHTLQSPHKLTHYKTHSYTHYKTI